MMKMVRMLIMEIIVMLTMQRWGFKHLHHFKISLKSRRERYIFCFDVNGDFYVDFSITWIFISYFLQTSGLDLTIYFCFIFVFRWVDLSIYYFIFSFQTSGKGLRSGTSPYCEWKWWWFWRVQVRFHHKLAMNLIKKSMTIPLKYQDWFGGFWQPDARLKDGGGEAAYRPGKTLNTRQIWLMA